MKIAKGSAILLVGALFGLLGLACMLTWAYVIWLMIGGPPVG